MYSLALIIFVASEKKAFEHFPIGFNVNLFPAVAAILDIRSPWKTETLLMTFQWLFMDSLASIVQEAFWNIFPIGSNINLSPAVAAILNFISEQKT